jgi:anaerobic magnesium-protoporphyrin IX monomethyl ester cyclase
VHDCTFLSFDEAAREIVTANPWVVSIYAMITMSRHAFALVRKLRPLQPGGLFLCGGPLPTLYPERFAGEFDLVFRGECDTTLARFCREFLDSGVSPDELTFLKSLDRYPGLYLRTGTGIVDNPPVHNPESVLGTLPLPDRSRFDHPSYQKFWQDNYGFTMASIMITRGCPYSCDFCSKPIWGNLFRKPPLDHVFAEISDIRRYGYDRIWIADDSFTLDDNYLREFCERMISLGVPVQWHCLSRVDGITPEIAAIMYRAGCRKVYLGLESGSDKTLMLMGKKTTVEAGVRAVHLFRNAGIGTCGFFLVGYPGESRESIRRTLALASSLPLDEVSVNVPFPLSGSPLFSRVIGVDTTADWDMANEIRFVYRSEFDREWLNKEIADALGRRDCAS